MNKKPDRKELIARYKETKRDVGVYRIINKQTGQYYLDSCTDIKSIYNKFEFGVQTNTPDAMPRKLAKEIKQYGFDSFSIEVLELLDIKPEMTQTDISEELKLLEEICREKLGTENEY